MVRAWTQDMQLQNSQAYILNPAWNRSSDGCLQEPDPWTTVEAYLSKYKDTYRNKLLDACVKMGTAHTLFASHRKKASSLFMKQV